MLFHNLLTIKAFLIGTFSEDVNIYFVSFLSVRNKPRKLAGEKTMITEGLTRLMKQNYRGENTPGIRTAKQGAQPTEKKH